jgi:hypothetical protein
MPTLSVKDVSRNEEMDADDMAAVEGGFSFPTGLSNIAVVKLIPVPQPVTRPNNGDYYGDGGGGSINPANSGPDGDDDLHQP